MGLGQLISWTSRQIRSRFFESLLIILAISLGVAVLSVVGTVVIKGTRELNMSDPEQNTITIQQKVDNYRAFYKSGNKIPAQLVGSIEAEEVKLSLDFIEDLQIAIPEIDTILAYEHQGGRLKGAPPMNETDWRSGPDPNWLTIIWTLPNLITFLNGELEKGSFYTLDDFKNQEAVAVIGYDLAQDLFPDRDPLGQLIELEHIDTPLTVIGVLKKVPEEIPERYTQFSWFRSEMNRYIFSPRHNYNQTNDPIFSSITLVPKSDDPTAKVKDYLLARYGDSLSVESAREELQFFLKSMQPMLIFIGGLASLALFIASLNILNLMLARVLKRTKSIGISKAIGASKSNIFWQFLIESLSLGLLGGLVGLGLVALATPLLKSLGEIFAISLPTVFLSLGASLTVSLIFGIYPAIKASRINPVDALRAE